MGNSNDFQRYALIQQETQQTLKSLSSSASQVSALMRNLQVTPVIPEEITRMMQQTEELRRKAQAAIRPQVEQMERLRKVFDTKMTPFRELQRAINERMEPFREFQQQMARQLANLPKFEIEVSRIALAYSSVRPSILEIACRPAVTGADYVAKTLQELEVLDEEDASRALLASVDCVTAEVAVQTDELVLLPRVVDLSNLDDASPGTETQVTHNLYELQREELLWVARNHPKELENESSLKTLPGYEHFTNARAVCGLVPLINNQRTTKGDEVIFKPTTRLVEAVVAIPNLVAVDRTTFGEFIDQLYFLLYEAAGADKLRFLEAKVVEADESEAVWTVKQLRNYFIRHDVEHGKESETKKKQVQVDDIFRRLIGKTIPTALDDYRNAQQSILREVRMFLEKLSSRL